jgi:hypothetical protein
MGGWRDLGTTSDGQFWAVGWKNEDEAMRRRRKRTEKEPEVAKPPHPRASVEIRTKLEMQVPAILDSCGEKGLSRRFCDSKTPVEDRIIDLIGAFLVAHRKIKAENADLKKKITLSERFTRI